MDPKLPQTGSNVRVTVSLHSCSYGGPTPADHQFRTVMHLPEEPPRYPSPLPYPVIEVGRVFGVGGRFVRVPKVHDRWGVRVTVRGPPDRLSLPDHPSTLRFYFPRT